MEDLRPEQTADELVFLKRRLSRVRVNVMHVATISPVVLKVDFDEAEFQCSGAAVGRGLGAPRLFRMLEGYDHRNT